MDATEKLTGCAIERAYVDKGCPIRGFERRAAVPLALDDAQDAALLAGGVDWRGAWQPAFCLSRSSVTRSRPAMADIEFVR